MSIIKPFGFWRNQHEPQFTANGVLVNLQNYAVIADLSGDDWLFMQIVNPAPYTTSGTFDYEAYLLELDGWQNEPLEQWPNVCFFLFDEPHNNAGSSVFIPPHVVDYVAGIYYQYWPTVPRYIGTQADYIKIRSWNWLSGYYAQYAVGRGTVQNFINAQNSTMLQWFGGMRSASSVSAADAVAVATAFYEAPEPLGCLFSSVGWYRASQDNTTAGDNILAMYNGVV